MHCKGTAEDPPYFKLEGTPELSDASVIIKANNIFGTDKQKLSINGIN